MTQLSPITENFGPGDQSWLGSRRGVDTAQTVTLDATACASLVTQGYIPSGVPLAYNPSTKKMEPYDHTGSGGTAYKATLAGFLVADVPVVVAPGETGVGDIVAAMLDFGRIVTNRLPVALGTTTPTTTGQFVFVTGATGEPVDGNSVPQVLHNPTEPD
jgi:hypothetical protein